MMQGVSSQANLTTDVWQQMPLPNFQYLIYQEKPNYVVHADGLRCGRFH